MRSGDRVSPYLIFRSLLISPAPDSAVISIVLLRGVVA